MVNKRIKIVFKSFWRDPVMIFNVEGYSIEYLSDHVKLIVTTNRHDRVAYINKDAISEIIVKENIEKHE